jgi:hypothetical protein
VICINCGKDFQGIRATAKYCSGACKLKYNRRSGPLNPQVEEVILEKTWQDLYAKCDGCDGKNCPSGFKPNSPNAKEFLKAHKV